MNVVGINASPRIGGNSDILLDKALAGAHTRGTKTEKIILNKLSFSCCQECEDMPNSGECNIADDFRQIHKKVMAADVLIIASPIFFGTLSAQVKKMIDRFQCAWRGKYLFKIDKFADKKRIGAFIAVEASERKDFFINAKSIVKNFFSVINAGYKEELFCPGVDEKAAILKHPDYLKKVFELGKKVAVRK